LFFFHFKQIYNLPQPLKEVEHHRNKGYYKQDVYPVAESGTTDPSSHPPDHKYSAGIRSPRGRNRCSMKTLTKHRLENELHLLFRFCSADHYYTYAYDINDDNKYENTTEPT